MSEYFFTCSEKKLCRTEIYSMNVFLDAGKQTMAFALEIINLIYQKLYYFAFTSFTGHVATVLHEVTSLWTPSHTRQVSWGVWN